MDLNTIPAELIEARGRYATVNGAYKDVMEAMQKTTQKACDSLRLVLQDENKRADHIAQVEMFVGMISSMVDTADELRAQKEDLYPAAWEA